MTAQGMLQLTVASLFALAASGAHSERVLLRDISALTLYNGRMTNYRRSSQVPQLKCVGGTAGCSAFVPQVVQCQNRGFDGYDVQWECKSDMDNAYRFGQVAVTCEGYDYPDDPYVLRGSCGLEYTIDYTKEGHQQANQRQHQYYGDDYHDRSNSYYDGSHYKKTGSGLGNLLFLAGVGFVIYVIYKTCLSGGTPPGPSAPNPDDPPPYSRHDNQAPPPGFKPEYTSQSSSGFAGGFAGGYPNSGGYANTGGYTNTGSYTNTGTGTGTGGGFWSGMATGGLLGYLFGNNQGYNNSYYRPTYTRHRPYGSSWGNSGMFGGNSYFGGSSGSRSSGGSFFGGGSSSSSSSGTRTASGFGGTKRR